MTSLKTFAKAVRRHCFRYPLFLIQDSIVGWMKTARRRRWTRLLRMDSRFVDPTTDVIGLVDYDRIQFDPYCRVDPQCTFWLDPGHGADATIRIGERSYIGRNGYLGASDSLTIESDCLIGAYVYITTAHHQYRDAAKLIREQGLYGGPILIQRGAWVGTHVVIMPGVTIGEGAIIGAGAVVTHDVPSHEIWAGVPAKKIGSRC